MWLAGPVLGTGQTIKQSCLPRIQFGWSDWENSDGKEGSGGWKGLWKASQQWEPSWGFPTGNIPGWGAGIFPGRKNASTETRKMDKKKQKGERSWGPVGEICGLVHSASQLFAWFLKLIVLWTVYNKSICLSAGWTPPPLPSSQPTSSHHCQQSGRRAVSPAVSSMWEALGGGGRNEPLLYTSGRSFCHLL